LKKHLKKYFWIILAILLIIIRWTGGLFPHLIEKFYSRGFFLGIRAVFDYSIGWIPIPMFYIFFLVMAVFLAQYIQKGWQTRRSFPLRVKTFGFHLLRFVSIVVVWFLGIWGFNYGRIPIEHQLNLELQPLSIEEIKEETQWATHKTLELRKLVTDTSTAALDETLLPKNLEEEMRASLKSVLTELGYPAFGRVRARELHPGVLMKWQTAGIYWFFVGEGNIDSGLHPLQKPFTTAHEMAHGYGFGDEGTCNFLAYLACLKSNQAYIRYAGMLSYWRYIATEYKIRLPLEYQKFRDANLSPAMENDLEAIYQKSLKYPSIFDSFRDATYDMYLKTQGMEDGIENYNRVVILVNGWKKQ
jgi:hypothetical protein